MVLHHLLNRNRDPRLPPGQHETKNFPVLQYGNVPKIDKATWSLKVGGAVENPVNWTWDHFQTLPMTDMRTDIHCVTSWSKFDTNWWGVRLDDIIERVKPKPTAKVLFARCYDDYSTNVPIEDVKGGQAMVALWYEGSEIERTHGGPARLFVPHLYFWKSAKWLKELEFLDYDDQGFWETKAYHNYGDPWKEQRYRTS